MTVMKSTILAGTRRCGVPTLLFLLALLALTSISTLAYCQTPYAFTTLTGIPNTPHFNPKSVAVDAAGNIYFADTRKQVICRMDLSGRVRIVAGKFGVSGSTDGTGSQARFTNPRGIAMDVDGNIIVADTGNNLIRRITPNGRVTTIAGLAGTVGSRDGTGIYARFDFPVSVAVDASDNIYVADLYNSTIRQVTPHGTAITIAGQAGVHGSVDGRGNAALFNFPMSIALDNSGNIYVADMLNNAIRKITPNGTVITWAGRLSYTPGNADGPTGIARFCHPCGVAVDNAGNVYVADSGNNTIRRISPDCTVTTLAGLAGQSGLVDGVGSAVRFGHPTALALDHLGELYVTDLDNTIIRKGFAGDSTNTALSLKTKAMPKFSYRE
jgi:sugar lactone lactonase YvrE